MICRAFHSAVGFVVALVRLRSGHRHEASLVPRPSSTDAPAKQLTGYYGRRWGIECGLRDTKDLRFGMGMGAVHVKSPERRDRLWLINAFAVVLLTFARGRR